MDERTVLTLGVRGGVSAADVPDLAAHAAEYCCVQAWSEDPNAAGALFGLAAATRTTTELQFGAGSLRVLGRALAVTRIEATTLQIYKGESNHLDGFRVDLDVPDPPAVHVAALGRRTRASASEFCDGAIVALMTAEAVGNAVIEVCSFACVTSFSHLGFGEAVDQFCHRWQAGDRAEAAAAVCERRERMRATVAALTLAA